MSGPRPMMHSSTEERCQGVAHRRARGHDPQAPAGTSNEGRRKGSPMSDPKGIDRSPEEPGRLSRRTVLRLGMLAVSATQLPVLPACAQGAKPGAHLIGKLEG